MAGFDSLREESTKPRRDACSMCGTKFTDDNRGKIILGINQLTPGKGKWGKPVKQRTKVLCEGCSVSVFTALMNELDRRLGK